MDACFANAGVIGSGVKSFVEMSTEEWRRVMRVNHDGTFHSPRSRSTFFSTFNPSTVHGTPP